ncbi:kinase-like domain-containing protein [Apiosordaria backusii]|uniref:Kinase-like domain-containing protein n=1 Tax=Apiosordaria backusii TaxID=314023 RepID=A0AA40BDY6_9PEZI|nr:kinase-like domain-containing protein [Apiosordaria backusii]
MVSSSLGMAKEALFYLIPQDDESRTIVKDNPKYQSRCKSILSLRVEAGNSSRHPGRVLSLGRLKQINHIVLYLQGMPEQQCSFQLSPAGELMLEDATTGHHTTIRCTDSRGNIIDKYRLQGDPRRRVIPMDRNLPLFIWLGSKIHFRFVWGDSFIRNVDTARKALFSIAEKTKVVGGATLQPQRSLNPAQIEIEPKSPNAPVVPIDLDKQPLRQTHTYKVLGEGAFGRVSLAVDLASGELFAVKECKKRTKKADFKVEVEQLAKLRHPNIVKLEHHQGWVEGMTVQIFLPLYDGSLTKLLPEHRCGREFPSKPPKWLGHFIDQVLSGLAFMHDKKIMHRDLKPDNILYKGSGSQLTFVISDFGLATSAKNIKDVGGTLVYLAPEATREGIMTRATDVYAFGLLLLEVLGRYCPREGDARFLSVADWRKKLETNLKLTTLKEKCRKYQDRAPLRNPFLAGFEARHGRVQSLSDCKLLRPSVEEILREDLKKRSTAAEARVGLLKDYEPSMLAKERKVVRDRR